MLTGRAFYKKWEHPVGFALRSMALAGGIENEREFIRKSWDPLTCLSVFSPQLFETKQGTIFINEQGITCFKANETGNLFLLRMKDVSVCGEEIEKNLLNVFEADCV